MKSSYSLVINVPWSNTFILIIVRFYNISREFVLYSMFPEAKKMNQSKRTVKKSLTTARERHTSMSIYELNYLKYSYFGCLCNNRQSLFLSSNHIPSSVHPFHLSFSLSLSLSLSLRLRLKLCIHYSQLHLLSFFSVSISHCYCCT